MERNDYPERDEFSEIPPQEPDSVDFQADFPEPTYHDWQQDYPAALFLFQVFGFFSPGLVRLRAFSTNLKYSVRMSFSMPSGFLWLGL